MNILSLIKKPFQYLHSKLESYFEHSINTDINNFKPDVIAIQDQPPSPTGRLLLWFICFIVFGALVWSCLATIDILASSQGKIIPVGSIKTVQANTAGVIKAINVKDGMLVKEGDVLFVLDIESAVAEKVSLEKAYSAELLKNIRSTAMIDSINNKAIKYPDFSDLNMLESTKLMQKILFEEEYKKFNSELSVLQEEINQKTHELAGVSKNIIQYKKTYEIVNKKLTLVKPLLDEGGISQFQYMEYQEKAIREENELNSYITKEMQLKASIEEDKEKYQSIYITTKREHLLAIEESYNNMNKLKEDIVKNEVIIKYGTIKAPVSGFVQELKYHTIGGVVEAAKEMLKIVESGADIEVETLILSKDIGFVRQGMPVAIKLDSFQFTKYGLVHGSVRSISEDAITDEKLGLVYPAKITLDRKDIDIDGKSVKLSYGMSLTAEIKTGQRKVIEFFTSPIVKHINESIRER